MTALAPIFEVLTIISMMAVTSARYAPVNHHGEELTRVLTFPPYLYCIFGLDKIYLANDINVISKHSLAKS